MSDYKFVASMCRGIVGVQALVVTEIAKAYEQSGSDKRTAFVKAVAQLGWHIVGETDFMPEVRTPDGTRFVPQLEVCVE